jgi:hypothetical protein
MRALSKSIIYWRITIVMQQHFAFLSWTEYLHACNSQHGDNYSELLVCAPHGESPAESSLFKNKVVTLSGFTTLSFFKHQQNYSLRSSVAWVRLKCLTATNQANIFVRWGQQKPNATIRVWNLQSDNQETLGKYRTSKMPTKILHRSSSDWSALENHTDEVLVMICFP